MSGHAGPIYQLHRGRTADHVLTISGDHFVAEWNIASGVASPFSVKLEHPGLCLWCSKDASYMACGTLAGGLHIINLREKKEEHLFKVHTQGVFALLEVADENWLIAGGGDGFLSVWEIGTWRLVRHFKVVDAKIRTLLVVDDRLHVGAGDGSITMLDLPWLNILNTFYAHEGGTYSLTAHPQKPVLISGGKDGLLKLWRRADHSLLMEIPAHNFSIYSMAVSPDQRLLATGSRDKTIKLWDLSSMDFLARIERPEYAAHTHSINSLLWLPETNQLISAGDDRKIKVWIIAP
ncbi:MAG: hypothetical protein RL226_1982 [Bacteroidota bacterium]